MGKHPRIAWPSDYDNLTNIDELLQCRICYDYMETAVMTACSHNCRTIITSHRLDCSICIRKFLHYKTQCPICFANTFEKDLQANRIVDEFIQHYLPLREKLVTCIKGAEIRSAHDATTMPSPAVTPSRPNRRNPFITPKKLETLNNIGSITNFPERNSPQYLPSKSPISPSYNPGTPTYGATTPTYGATSPTNGATTPTYGATTPQRIADSPCYCPSSPSIWSDKPQHSPLKLQSKSPQQLPQLPRRNLFSESLAVNQDYQPSPSTSKSSKLLFDFTPKSRGNVEDKQSSKVTCPVCQVEIPAPNINKHLDDCLQRKNSMLPPRCNKKNMKPMPKYVFNLMKDAELRRLLKQNSLSTVGTRKLLEKRLQRFSALYNAECDKLEPKSIAEIAKMCEDEELAEKHVQKVNTTEHILNVDRKADPSVIEKAQKEYLQKHKTEFQMLIDAVKDREDSSSKVVRTLFSSNNNDKASASTSSSRQFVSHFDNENDQTYTASPNFEKTVMLDSDSNASCPLQHYSSGDAMRFCTVDLSSDSMDSKVTIDRTLSNDSSCKIPTIDSPAKPEILHENSQCSTTKQSGSSTVSSSLNTIEVNIHKQLPSDIDIFDASTEDNWSESEISCQLKTRQKKLIMKRAKGNPKFESSDSETEFEPCSGKTTKKQWKNDIGEDISDGMAEAFKCEWLSNDGSNLLNDTEVTVFKTPCETTSKVAETALDLLPALNEDKENAKLTVVDTKRHPRRSSRKRDAASRTNVSEDLPHATRNKRVKKVLEDQNCREKSTVEDQLTNGFDDGPNAGASSSNVDRPGTRASGIIDNDANPRRSLRKRPNR